MDAWISDPIRRKGWTNVMKKILSLLLCLAMLLTLGLTAMGQAEDGGELRVSLCIAETLGDLGFYDSANEGLKRLEADYGVIGSVVECKSDASMYQVALVEAAEQSDVVVAVGWQFWDGLTAVVPEMPDTKFIFVDNGLDGVGDNLLSITYAENEGSFLAGYVAMKLAQSGIVGVIGGENSDTINNFVVGYKQGALYANPDGTVLDPVYTDDYEAPDKGKEAALSLYSQGADVVYAVAGKTGLGVFEAAQEQGKYAVGVDSDQKYINPDVIICSMLKRVGDSVYDVISNYLEDGVFDGGTLIAFVDGFVTDEPDLTDDMYENAALHNENGAWQMIFGVNTLPEYRKRGHACELIRRAIADARQQGRKGLVLTCKERLIAYYAKFGFVDEGVSEKSTHGNVRWHQMRLTF